MTIGNKKETFANSTLKGQPVAHQSLQGNPGLAGLPEWTGPVAPVSLDDLLKAMAHVRIRVKAHTDYYQLQDALVDRMATAHQLKGPKVAKTRPAPTRSATAQALTAKNEYLRAKQNRALAACALEMLVPLYRRMAALASIFPHVAGLPNGSRSGTQPLLGRVGIQGLLGLAGVQQYVISRRYPAMAPGAVPGMTTPGLYTHARARSACLEAVATAHPEVFGTFKASVLEGLNAAVSGGDSGNSVEIGNEYLTETASAKRLLLSKILSSTALDVDELLLLTKVFS